MNTQDSRVSRTRKNLFAAVASIAIASAIGFGAVTSGTAPVLADAVKVQAAQVPSFADVVEKVSPAVVSVQVKAKIEPAADRGGDMSGDQNFDNLPPQMKRFFREFGENGGNGFGDQDGGPRFQQRERHGDRQRGPRPVAQGSGFFISDDGYLVTNNHVVEGGSAFTVVTNNGDELDAKLIGTDPRTDLAVLKVDDSGHKFTYVAFADDSKVRVGDWVVAVGNPFGLGGTVTSGIVSARGRDIGAGPYDDFLQIDAAVNRGNSGGPAFNLSGEVVGINTAIFSPSGGNVGIAFAIPASTANAVVQDLMHDGSVSRGWIGVQIQPVNKDIADSLGLKDAKGAIVAEPQADGPAAKAGIKSGDVITAVDGKDVAGPRELARMIGAIEPGKSVDVTVWRSGKSETIKMELGTLPTDKQASNEQGKGQKQAEPTSLADLGLTVSPSDDGKGLVITDVDPESDAADRGIQAGDVITSVNSREIANAGDVTAAMKEAESAGRKAVLVQVTREDNSRFVALPINQG